MFLVVCMFFASSPESMCWAPLGTVPCRSLGCTGPPLRGADSPQGALRLGAG